MRRDLEKQGALEAVRSDVARGKALQFLVDHATVVDEDGNEIDLTFAEETDDQDTNEALTAADESAGEAEDEPVDERSEA